MMGYDNFSSGKLNSKMKRLILFSHNEYTVTKDDADSLHHKAERFIAETVSLTMVTVSGIAHPLFGVF